MSTDKEALSDSVSTERALDLALEALEESVDLVREDYENAKKLYSNYPSRQARLLGLEDRLSKHEAAITAIKQARSAPVQEPLDTLISAWQALEETSGHVLDVGDVEGRMHMSVIRSAWEQMDSLVREMWDERGRP